MNLSGWIEPAGRVLGAYLGAESEDELMSPLVDLASGRTFNFSSTLTAAQALLLVLGIAGVLGALGLGAYLFALSMASTSSNSGYGYGGGSGYGQQSSGYNKRSAEDEDEAMRLLEVMALIGEFDQRLAAMNVDREDAICRQLAVCAAVASNGVDKENSRGIAASVQKAEKYLSKMGGIGPRGGRVEDLAQLVKAARKGRRGEGHKCIEAFQSNCRLN